VARMSDSGIERVILFRSRRESTIPLPPFDLPDVPGGHQEPPDGCEEQPDDSDRCLSPRSDIEVFDSTGPGNGSEREQRWPARRPGIVTAVGQPVAKQGEERDDRLANLDPEVRGVAVASQREHLGGQADDDQTYDGFPNHRGVPPASRTSP